MGWLKLFSSLFERSPKIPAPYVPPGAEGQAMLTARLLITECVLYQVAAVGDLRRGQPASPELVAALWRAYESFRDKVDIAFYGHAFAQEATYVLGQGDPEIVRPILEQIGALPGAGGSSQPSTPVPL